ncbi:Hairy and enhancer of split [Nesidiocoris tenuis]|uniref:Hairy and enhancer of split n=1 Tax=Nesidiocoris tenuis TaxID=355587 RepID=A0ABN7AVX0_9HEMI|nr:Hairy and enhancer of split [Nesidiocoris tenuis]
MCANDVRPKKMNETRKIRKPLMEKKRRARINDCLEELKKMLLLNKKESFTGTRPSKLEKADILEQTVELVRRLTGCNEQTGGYESLLKFKNRGSKEHRRNDKLFAKDNDENRPPPRQNSKLPQPRVNDTTAISSDSTDTFK